MCMVGGQAQVLHVCGRGQVLHVCGREHKSGAPGSVGVDGCKVMRGGRPGVPPVQNGRINFTIHVKTCYQTAAEGYKIKNKK